MNCASLEATLADLVWVEEEAPHHESASYVICVMAVVALLILVTIVIVIVRNYLRQPRKRLTRILQNPPSAAALDEIHSLIKKLRKEIPQLERVAPELDRLRFAPQPPTSEQMEALFIKIREICG